MKKIILSLLVIAGLSASAQTEKNPFPKTITVNGSAEMEIVPDEIYVQVDLKEYEKKGSGKVGLDKIRQAFLTAVRSMNLPDSAVSIAAYDGMNGNPWWRKKNKLKDELYASIAYSVKLRSSAQVDQLVDKLDDAATQNFFIQRTSHSRLTEFRKNLKIQAVKAAKEKAIYLAEAIDEKAGEAVTINEPNEYYQPYYGNMTANRMMKSEAMDAAAPEQAQADFKKIKLKYDVSVVFALK
ncbi:MAG: SIMPL domain-containing protein [Bacteroidota bacterium]